MQIEILDNGKPVIGYTENGTVVTIGGEGGIAVDCAALQADAAVTVDICRDAAGNLVQGVSEGKAYVASLVIPPQEKSEQVQMENGEPVLDDSGSPVYEVVTAPVAMSKVRLVLWPFVVNEEVPAGQEI